MLIFRLRRLVDLLDKTNGKVAYGGRSNVADKFVEVTLVKDVPKDDILLEDEVGLINLTLNY